jgi:hypothetical protein
VQQDRGGYFVRLGALPDAPVHPGSDPIRAHHDPVPTHPHGAHAHRHVRFKLRPLSVVALALGAWFVWAATTDGGIAARFDDIGDKLRGAVEDATTDPGLRRATTYYNRRYAQAGSYPKLSEEELREDPDAGFGIGVEVEWCSGEAIVLRSLTGRGTISRLLAGGQDLGDVSGRTGCPTNLANPAPWQYPTTAD